jgi:hypothetical protein
MPIEWVVVGAFVLYAVIYLGRYVLRMLKGKKTGCGCGSESGCAKTGTADSKK